MKRAILALFLMVAATFAEGPVTPPGIQVLGTPDENNVLVYTNGYLADSGVAPTNLVVVSNQLTKAEAESTYATIEDVNAIPISDKSFTSITNLAKLHILEASQSNGTKTGPISNIVFSASDRYSNQWLNIVHYAPGADTNTVEVDYIGTNVWQDGGWGANIFGGDSLRELISPDIEIYFTHVGQGGAGIEKFVEGGLLYDPLTNSVAETAATYGNAGTPDIIWLTQNENDWGIQFDDFFSDMRSLYGDDIKFVIRGRNDKWGSYTNANDQLAIQLAASDTNVVYVSAKNLPLRDDGIHFTDPAMLECGQIMAAGSMMALSGAEIQRNITASVGAFDKVSGRILVAGRSISGSAEIGTSLKAGYAEDIGGVTISNGVIYNATIDGLASIAAPADSSGLKYRLEFDDAIDVGPTNYNHARNGGVVTSDDNVPVWSFDTDRRTGIIETDRAVTNWVSLPYIGQDTNSVTFSLWFNPTVDGNADAIISCRGTSVNASLTIHNGFGGTAGNVAFTARSLGGNALSAHSSGGGFLQVGTWYHLAMVCDRSNDILSAYINGVLAGSNNSEDLSSDAAATGPMAIGKWGFDGSYIGLNSGEYDNVTVYDRALVSEEIASIYALEAAGKRGVQ